MYMKFFNLIIVYNFPFFGKISNALLNTHIYDVARFYKFVNGFNI
jgi:hypothetical protein